MRRSNVRELRSVVDLIFFMFCTFSSFFFFSCFEMCKKYWISLFVFAPTSRVCPRKFSISNNTSTNAETAEICDFSRRLARCEYDAGCHIGNELGVTRVFLSVDRRFRFCVLKNYVVFSQLMSCQRTLDILFKLLLRSWPKTKYFFAPWWMCTQKKISE